MKKFVSLLLIIVLCFSIISCGASESTIEKKLQGTWSKSWYAAGIGKTTYVSLEFDDGKVTYTNSNYGTQYGFYTIDTKNEIIKVKYEGYDEEYEYLYDHGVFELVGYTK